MKNKEIIKLLELIINSNYSDFTGLGIIIYKDKIGLPIESMNENCYLKKIINGTENISKYLLEISNRNIKCHDGFHLINHNFQLTDISYYFSTPIITNMRPKKMKGSRYRTAFYGSMIENIICTISIGSNFEAFIFINGKEYTLDEYRIL